MPLDVTVRVGDAVYKLSVISGSDGAYKFLVPTDATYTIRSDLTEGGVYYYMDNDTKVYTKTIEAAGNFTANVEKIKITNGNMSSFVRWLQLCCDLIILFGIGGVALTGMFPHALWPYIVLCWLSPLMFGYIVYSLSKYGDVVEDATRVSDRLLND